MDLLIFILGVVVGIAAMKLAEFTQKHELHFKWWQYIVGLIWAAWVALGFVLTYESFAEYEPRASMIMLVFFGGTALIGAVLMARFWFSGKMQLAK